MGIGLPGGLRVQLFCSGVYDRMVVMYDAMGVRRAAGEQAEAINELRAQGKKVGQIKVRSFRPFPSEDICEALKNVKAFAVMDKDDSFNAHCGPMFAEVTSSLYAAGISGPKGVSYIYGLGGRDVRVESIQHVFAELEKIAATGEVGETIATWMSGNKEGNSHGI
mgnify:CR=1 FL=1